MKILYINSLDKRYGSTYRSRNIVKALIGLGHNVQYVESNLEEDIFDNCIGIKQKDGIIGYFKATCDRALITFKLDYDVLFFQKFTPLTILSLIVGKLKRKKCIVDWDDLDWALQNSIIKKVLVFICELFGPYLADKITTHSFLLKEYAQRRGIKNIFIVNQIVNFENVYVPEEEKRSIRKRYNLEGKKVLGYLCTLTEGGARDIDMIIKWASKLINIDNIFFLFVIGGGPLENRTKNLLMAHNLKLTTSYAITGIIAHQDVPKYLSVCDIGLVYMRDNLGNRMRVSFKVLEYLALGIPVAGRLSGETKDRLSEFCYDVDSQNDFSKVVKDMFRNHKNRFIHNNMEEYSLNNTIKSLDKVVN